MPKDFYQELPNAGPDRETLREKGQFWTPDWVAEPMVAYVLIGGSESIFDPAVGKGVFFHASNKIANELGRRVVKRGTEIDDEVLMKAQESGLSMSDLKNVDIRDFVLNPPKGAFKAIVANPPYIRHHRISRSVKEKLKLFSKSLIGVSLDGRAGLHIYFLLRALQLLERNGRLAFIMPADTCEGIFAKSLWEWISANFRIDAVIGFSPEATPFPRVDTNPIIFFISNTNPST